MAGGAETHNLVVLLSRDIYDEYVEARTNLTLTPEEVRHVAASGQRRNCTTFGIHGSLPVLKTTVLLHVSLMRAGWCDRSSWIY